MYKISIEEQPSQEDLDTISNGLTVHAMPFTGDREAFVDVAVLLKDNEGTLKLQ